MKTGYTHGWLECRLCYKGNENPLAINDWRLYNNPGYAGGSSPRTLLLGFSKGANQNKAAYQGDYDKVAFAGMRPRVREVLKILSLMPEDRSIDDLFTGREEEFGSTSLARCSLCRKEGDDCITSGSMVTDSFNVPKICSIIRRCAFTYLSHLPVSIELVILFGTNTPYIQRSRRLFKELYPDYRDINEVAFQARGALWLYVAHPSPANGHFRSWIEKRAGTSSGEKCNLALKTLKDWKRR